MVEKHKVWGSNVEIHSDSSSSTNVLYIKQGGVCSWHYHRHKWNTFYVISGQLGIVCGSGEDGYTGIQSIGPGEHFHISPGEKHKFIGLKDSVVIEVMYVKYEPEDIERLVLGYFDDDIAQENHDEQDEEELPGNSMG